MKPESFISLGLTDGFPVHVTLTTPEGTQRNVRLFFRGYAIRNGASVARSASGLAPLFSAPNGRGGINRRYYRQGNTPFDSITDIHPIEP